MNQGRLADGQKPHPNGQFCIFEFPNKFVIFDLFFDSLGFCMSDGNKIQGKP